MGFIDLTITLALTLTLTLRSKCILHPSYDGLSPKLNFLDVPYIDFREFVWDFTGKVT